MNRVDNYTRFDHRNGGILPLPMCAPLYFLCLVRLPFSLTLLAFSFPPPLTCLSSFFIRLWAVWPASYIDRTGESQRERSPRRFVCVAAFIFNFARGGRRRKRGWVAPQPSGLIRRDGLINCDLSNFEIGSRDWRRKRGAGK